MHIICTLSILTCAIVQNQHYSIVEHKKGSGKGQGYKISKAIHDDVVYTEVTPKMPQKIAKGSQ